jgi:5-oxoprolinase (ATP-hydrolysing)
MVRIVPRAHSATADAYLTPELKRYLQGYVQKSGHPLTLSFQQSFKNLRPGMLQFMQSDGGRKSKYTITADGSGRCK